MCLGRVNRITRGISKDCRYWVKSCITAARAMQPLFLSEHLSLAIFCPSGIFLHWTVNRLFQTIQWALEIFIHAHRGLRSLTSRNGRERGRSEKKSGEKIVPGSGPFLDPKGSDAWSKFYHGKSFKGKYNLHFIERTTCKADLFILSFN